MYHTVGLKNQKPTFITCLVILFYWMPYELQQLPSFFSNYTVPIIWHEYRNLDAPLRFNMFIIVLYIAGHNKRNWTEIQHLKLPQINPKLVTTVATLQLRFCTLYYLPGLNNKQSEFPSKVTCIELFFPMRDPLKRFFLFFSKLDVWKVIVWEKTF